MIAEPRRVDAMVQTLRSLMLPLRAAPGFVACDLYSAVGQPNALRYVEEWQTPADLDRQIRSNHFTRLLALMEDAAEPPELRLNWIADSRGLDYLETVRLGGR